MRAPKILNDGGEGGVIEPHSFEAERFRTVGMQSGGGGGKDPDATTKANGIRTTNVVKAKGRVDFLSSKT